MKRPADPPKRYTVFEARNQRLREIFVAMTAVPMFEAIERVGRRPPAAIRHWEFEDIQSFRSLEFGLDAASARALIKHRLAHKPPAGWRCLPAGARPV